MDFTKTQEKELLTLIKNTESMDDKERVEWKKVHLPKMSIEQKIRLYTILKTEKEKLDELEKKYSAEVKQLNEKHLKEWVKFQSKK